MVLVNTCNTTDLLLTCNRNLIEFSYPNFMLFISELAHLNCDWNIFLKDTALLALLLHFLFQKIKKILGSVSVIA